MKTVGKVFMKRFKIIHQIVNIGPVQLKLGDIVKILGLSNFG